MFVEQKLYRTCRNEFWKMICQPQKSFNHQKYENETILSKQLWKLKSENFTTYITWKILRRCPPFNRAQVKCNLCLNEKLEIALYQENNLLNKRTELVSKCKHFNKHLLMNYKDKDKWRQCKPLHCFFTVQWFRCSFLTLFLLDWRSHKAWNSEYREKNSIFFIFILIYSSAQVSSTFHWTIEKETEYIYIYMYWMGKEERAIKKQKFNRQVSTYWLF